MLVAPPILRVSCRFTVRLVLNMDLSDMDAITSISGGPAPPPKFSSADAAAFRRLAENIGSLLVSTNLDFCSDARINVAAEAKEVRVHKCVLSARSPFFRDHFASGADRVELGEIMRGFQVGYAALMMVLGYIYSGKVGVLPSGVCECADEECKHEACWPAVDFMLQVIHSSFVFQIYELVSLFERHLLDILHLITIDDIPKILNVVNMCSNDCSRLYSKCLNTIVYSDFDIGTLKRRLPLDMVKQIIESRSSLGLSESHETTVPDHHVTKIYEALDFDDVALVKLLLEERNTTLDDAYALHYAVAHCTLKIIKELFELGPADINSKNLRGYNVLHIAAMRQEPEIILFLLDAGANPSDVTFDGKKALQIAKRKTKAVDYSKQNVNPSPNGRVCIEILECVERRDTILGLSISPTVIGDDLFQKLDYFENRVNFAKLFFPVEAKAAMENASVDGTLVFSSVMASSVSFGNSKVATISDNIPSDVMEKLVTRLRALERTVELGMHFFPRCSSIINNFLHDSLSEPNLLADSSKEDLKRIYWDLHEVINKAYLKDKEEFNGARQWRSKCPRR